MKILKSIFLFCILHFAFYISSNAQIVYTDMADTTIIRSTFGASLYGIDLNNDGTTDVQFRVGRFKACAGNMQANCIVSINTSVDSNEYVADIVGVQKLVINNILNSNSVWDNQHLILRSKSVNLLNCHISYTGHWTTTSDGYVGIKFFASNLIYYGWVRISVQLTTSTAILIFKDYAYNSIPSQPIHSGETSCATPTVNLTQSSPLSFCAGDSVTITANGTGYQYQWKKNNVNIAGAKSQTYVAKTAGVYKCKVTNSCGSKLSTGKTVTVPCRNSTGNVVEVLEHLFVYPNPASQSITISFSLTQSQKVSLKIFDLNGRLVSVLADKIFEEGDSEIVWNAAEVNAGVYFLQFQSGEKLQMEKLIVTK